MNSNDWNPSLYLKFGKERTQPSIDLVSRIIYENPKKIIDIGCGPGNSTQILVNRWPDAEILGVDKSPAMVEKAKNDYPDQEWKIFDAEKDILNEKFDLIFSNAVIQWIPDHKSLIHSFYEMLNSNGILAVQVPMFFDMTLSNAIENAANSNRWSAIMKNVLNIFTIENYTFYYDVLSKIFKSVDIWQTDYMNILDSHGAMVQMIKSTGLKPYLDLLDDDKEKTEFETDVLEQTKLLYPQQEDGKVILPFKRLFFVAVK